MAEVKTKVNDTSVTAFLNKIVDVQVREDCLAVVEIMQSATKCEPRMWGSAIVGFGEYTMVYPNGREAAWMITGFSPRKQNITLYTGSSFPEHDALLAQLGKHSCGKGCLYIKRMSDVELPILRKLVQASVDHKIQGQGSARTSAVKSSKTKTSAKTSRGKQSTARKTAVKPTKKKVGKKAGKKTSAAKRSSSKASKSR